MRSSVDFPQPLGPTMQTNSPGATLQIDVVDARRRVPCAADVFAAQACDLDRRAAPLRGHRLAPRRAVTPASAAARSLLSLFWSVNGPSFCCGVVDVAR